MAVFALLTVAATSARAEPPTAVPVDGEPSPAELTAIDAQWQLTFGSGEKRRTLPADELVCWGACAEAVRGPIVVTADGGLLPADVYRADKESLTVDSELFGAVKLPLDSLAGAVFDPPAGRRPRDLLLDRVARAESESDRLVLHNGDEISGTVDRIEDDIVHLETDVGSIEIESHRIAALIFNPGLRQETKPQGLHAWAGFRDGSRLIVSQLLLDGPSLKVTTLGGQTWKTSPKELVWLQPLGGRVTYLSDLKAAGYRHVPYLSLPWPYHADRNVTGGWLRSGGRLYLKGLGVHSAARLTYTLDGQYRRFQAELGIDDSTAGGGSVRFRVFVDGHQKYASETVCGGMEPVPVAVDVSGAKRLDLVVDYADLADQLDKANWLNARLVK